MSCVEKEKSNLANKILHTTKKSQTFVGCYLIEGSFDFNFHRHEMASFVNGETLEVFWELVSKSTKSADFLREKKYIIFLLKLK